MTVQPAIGYVSFINGSGRLLAWMRALLFAQWFRWNVLDSNLLTKVDIWYRFSRFIFNTLEDGYPGFARTRQGMASKYRGMKVLLNGCIWCNILWGFPS